MENQKNVLDLSMYTTEALIADLPANRQFFRDVNGKWFILNQEILGDEVFNKEILRQNENESFRDFLYRYFQGAYELGYKGAFLSERKEETHITLNIGKLVEKMEIHTTEDAIKVSNEMQELLANALNNVMPRA